MTGQRPEAGGARGEAPELVFLDHAGLGTLTASLLARMSVMAPVRRGRVSHAFEWLSDPRQLTLDYVRTILPPKRAVLPYQEVLFTLAREPEARLSPVLEDESYALLGIHPCDLYAIRQLDWAYLERHGHADAHYAARREAAIIIGAECLPDEYCFCTSLGLAQTRGDADLFLTPAGDGYVVEVLTVRGRDLLARVRRRQPTAEERARWEGWPAEKERRTQLRLRGRLSEYPDYLEQRYASAAWPETAARCYSCGTCTNVCPTCLCFDVTDELAPDMVTGQRFRRYDSCQHLDFALVAGPHNFRPKRPDRVRHRWFRKYAWLFREFGVPFCVGCGRCTQQCTANISWVDVLNTVAAEAMGEAAG